MVGRAQLSPTLEDGRLLGGEAQALGLPDHFADLRPTSPADLAAARVGARSRG